MFRMCGCAPVVSRRIESLAVGPDEPIANVEVGINTVNQPPVPESDPAKRISQAVAISPTLTFRSVYSTLSGMTTTTEVDFTPLYNQFTVQPEPRVALLSREIDQLVSFLFSYTQHRPVSQRRSMPIYSDVARDRDSLIALAELSTERMRSYAESFLQRDAFLAFFAILFNESPFRHLTKWKDLDVLQDNRYRIQFTQQTTLCILANYLGSHWSDTAGVQMFYAIRADLRRQGIAGATISDLQVSRKSGQILLSQGTTLDSGPWSRRLQNRMVILSKLKCGTLLRITGAIEPDESYRIDCFELCCFFEILLALLDAVS